MATTATRRGVSAAGFELPTGGRGASAVCSPVSEIVPARASAAGPASAASVAIGSGAGAAPSRTARTAIAMVAASANRASGSRAIARAISADTAGGTSSSAGGSDVAACAITSPAVAPACGNRPLIAQYSVAPSW